MRTTYKHSHPYFQQRVSLATKHEKERFIARPLRVGLALEVVVPMIDTDQLGTFTGEVPRIGTANEVVLQKARMGMQVTGLHLGLANEGSFGMHPLLPFIPSDHELLLFVDDERGFQIIEQVLSEKTNFAHCITHTTDGLEPFLKRIGFPTHGLIVRPASGIQDGLLFKGITTLSALTEAVHRCTQVSEDKQAHVETDMRAHMNPTRGRIIRTLAIRMTRRLACLCPHCHTPGWGMVDVVRGLPCEWCGAATELVQEEIDGCPLCSYRESRARRDGLTTAPAAQCPECNP